MLLFRSAGDKLCWFDITEDIEAFLCQPVHECSSTELRFFLQILEAAERIETSRQLLIKARARRMELQAAKVANVR